MLIITGTGGSGTSFVAELYAAMGADIGWGPGVGFDGKTGGEDLLCTTVNNAISAGNPPAPEILCAISIQKSVVKHPSFTGALATWLDAGAKIDGVIVCVRDSEDAARSFIARGFEEAGSDPPKALKDAVRVRRERLGRLWETVVLRGVPAVCIPFPKILEDPKALFSVLPTGDTTEEKFLEAFKKVARPEQVASWREESAKPEPRPFDTGPGLSVETRCDYCQQANGQHSSTCPWVIAVRKAEVAKRKAAEKANAESRGI